MMKDDQSVVTGLLPNLNNLVKKKMKENTQMLTTLSWTTTVDLLQIKERKENLYLLMRMFIHVLINT